MSVTGLESVQSAGNTSTSSSKAVLDNEDFLNLLVAQLQAQDPLNPMDSTDFTAQLAQFSSLEQLQNMNESMEYLLLYQSSMNNAQAVSFIGKEIRAIGNQTQVNEGVVDPIHFELQDDAQAVYIHVYNEAGELIRTVETGAIDAGQQSYTWDGKDDEGQAAPDGVYTFEVLAVDELDESVTVTPYIIGVVDGLELKNNATYVVTGGIEVPLGNIIEIKKPELSVSQE
ncbi:MAG TPA: flagellar hook capping FlgD N-terminal domain-containing protein [Thermodesulfobacteriota bacterium]|nr:hypothetical protein [Deltaproteobacteria bacterium]HNR13748.1 flagellar hook capping FlgD N-terminal domain-containing protein [Thermodesulfobacteriota bacterium]HNU70130.1 flagellar hook capping FlgD N-terminal domain-containing protein [Thermodesulfobacteriota bacterium]HOC38010.1 flagellar hook capping FlgD N-terminal domain-containing protein [Thermodesulfobacteriota bacterium]